jgi:hypothetical protein
LAQEATLSSHQDLMPEPHTMTSKTSQQQIIKEGPSKGPYKILQDHHARISFEDPARISNENPRRTFIQAPMQSIVKI